MNSASELNVWPAEVLRHPGGLPHVLEVEHTDDSIRIRLEINEDNDWFEGHFPGSPVLPGVVQLQWAIHLLRRAYAIDASPQKIQRLKFRNVVIPPARVDMELEKLRDRVFRFNCHWQEKQFSLGQIHFPE